MKKRLIIAGGVLLCLVACAFLYKAAFRYGKNKDGEEWVACVVTQGPIGVSVECNGHVMSRLDVQIKCKAGGEVVELPYDVSDKVKKGDLLARLDPVDEQRRVRQGRVKVLSSQARLMQAEKNLEMAVETVKHNRRKADAALDAALARARSSASQSGRAQKLLQLKQVSPELAETAETLSAVAAADGTNAIVRIDELKVEEEAIEIQRQNVALSKAQLDSDQIDLEIAEQRLKDTSVFAPIEGVISDRQIEIGQIISSPMNNVGEGTTLLVISDLAQMFIIAAVDESDIGKIRAGQRATITTDAFPNEKFPGKVVRIATKGNSVQDVVTFEVRIEVLGAGKEKLKPGMTANLSVHAAENDKALLVPSPAVDRSNDQITICVRDANGAVSERAATTGIDDGTLVEVVSGVSAGETVVYSTKNVASRWSRKNSPEAQRMRARMISHLRGGG